MEHENLVAYLSTIQNSKFGTTLGQSGGYISFKNSGQRGSIKEFTLSLEAILSGLTDILENLPSFQPHSTYAEKEWRDLGSQYFSDTSLNSIITVQTKPAFTTFAKIICWANNLPYPGDNEIPLSKVTLATTIDKLKLLIDSYKPNIRPTKKLPPVYSILPKPFLLLAGISGTGKTRFVREQANAHHMNGQNFCLVPVRPDWHEPSDLLGYISRIGGTPEYISTPVLTFIIEAWKAVAPKASAEGMGPLDLDCPPFWLCLDEMNLAPVEQYFADYLSVLESRQFADDVYSCDALLDKSILATPGADIQKDLKLKEDEGLWQFFCANGISLPPNLIVAGTVNMDETTHGFSRKVIDRAVTIDFGEFFPNDYQHFFDGQSLPKTLTYSLATKATRDNINNAADPDGSKTIAFLEAVNAVLRSTPFELAYRALNEILLHVGAFAPENDEQLQAVWDDFMMTKVLPRIDGDDDKLRINVDDEPANLLEKLGHVLANELALIWPEDRQRIDLLRVDADQNIISDIACRSRKKLDWMTKRLATNTFTNYWP